MPLPDPPLAILGETVYAEVIQSQKDLQSPNISKSLSVKLNKSEKSCVAKGLRKSRSSDSGKSSSCSPILLDCSYDSGIAGVIVDGAGMQLHKRIQQCQSILSALERDHEYFLKIRNRLSKITNRKQKKPSENEFFCNVCCAEIDENDEKTYVKCYICKKYICRNVKCSDWLPKISEWECELCQTSKESLAQTSSWVADQITFNQEKLLCPPRARSEIYIPISEYNDSFIHFESVSQIGARSNAITAEEKFKIREYVEEVVAKLLGGNLDTIAVNQLSKSEDYLPNTQVNNVHSEKSQQNVADRAKCHDFSDISETRLREMIQKIIAETISLPPLQNGHAVSEKALDRSRKTSDTKPLTNNGYLKRHRTEHYFAPTIYQDLLATAVINKIVGKQLSSNQGIPESSCDDDDDVNGNIRLANSDQNDNVEKLSSSESSVEPRSDCSYPEVEQILNNNDDKSYDLLQNSDRDSVMSDYLANHMIPFPDLHTMATESEEDDYTSVTSSAVGDGTWEKNWLFKKKKSTLSTSVTSSSVGMLVPDPKEDVRAQIGDKTADEVSDLSELGSDSDDSLNSLRSQLEPINDRLINKHLIGGQNSKIILDELIECSSIVTNTMSQDEQPVCTDACNEHVIDIATKNEAINDKVNQQQTTTDQQFEDNKEQENYNSSSLTDQLSYDSSPINDSRIGTVEEYIENDNYEKDILAINLTNKPTTNTTNTSTEINYNANTNATKKYKRKKPVTNIPSTPPNKKSPENLLTSAVQNKDTPIRNTRRFRGNLNKNDNISVQICKAGKDYIDIDVGANNNDVGDNNDGVNEDDEDDDVVAIFRHFVPGSIAEREYKKWYNAVDMPNNPYAPEALKRRISGSQERFIDFPNISPTKDLNSLDLLNEPKLEPDENLKLENDYKRYSRDYYINSSLTAPQMSPAIEVPIAKDKRESTNITTSSTEIKPDLDVYKALPAQVIDMEATSLTSTELHTNLISTSEDSDTIKVNDFVKQQDANAAIKDTEGACREETASKETTYSSAVKKSESKENILTSTRGSTPVAFKFLQPKRKLLEPNQVLTTNDEVQQVISSQLEKPVIEEEVVKSLPSVKALARAFLMTSNTTQPENLWLRKAKTLSQGEKKPAAFPKRSLDPIMLSESVKPEDDVTITSDLSSLETDSSSFGAEIANTSNLTSAVVSSTNDPASLSLAGNTSPVPVRQGVLKNNIAFFENLKNN